MSTRVSYRIVSCVLCTAVSGFAFGVLTTNSASSASVVNSSVAFSCCTYASLPIRWHLNDAYDQSVMHVIYNGRDINPQLKGLFDIEFNSSTETKPECYIVPASAVVRGTDRVEVGCSVNFTGRITPIINCNWSTRSRWENAESTITNSSAVMKLSVTATKQLGSQTVLCTIAFRDVSQQTSSGSERPFYFHSWISPVLQFVEGSSSARKELDVTSTIILTGSITAVVTVVMVTAILLRKYITATGWLSKMQAAMCQQANNIRHPGCHDNVTARNPVVESNWDFPMAQLDDRDDVYTEVVETVASSGQGSPTLPAIDQLGALNDRFRCETETTVKCPQIVSQRPVDDYEVLVAPDHQGSDGSLSSDYVELADDGKGQRETETESETTVKIPHQQRPPWDVAVVQGYQEPYSSLSSDYIELAGCELDHRDTETESKTNVKIPESDTQGPLNVYKALTTPEHEDGSLPSDYVKLSANGLCHCEAESESETTVKSPMSDGESDTAVKCLYTGQSVCRQTNLYIDKL